MKGKWIGDVPHCDFCKETKDEFIDGATKYGPWGIMCPNCFGIYGVGIGPGRGQRYSSTTKEKLE